MNSPGKSTAEVARELGITVYRLAYLIKTQRLVPPAQVGGTRVWLPADIARARIAHIVASRQRVSV